MITEKNKANNRRRVFGEHLTPIEIFESFILPEIKDKIYNYIWVDLFAGEGNLILPILKLIPEKNRIEFFEKHIYIFDIQNELVERAIENAMVYGIPKNIAEKNITQRDTIKDYPKFLLNLNLPIYHITNPPYLYVGYIVKHNETRRYLDYFKNNNEGYQDLYQLALINDLRFGIQKMIYLIPSNFLFGFSVSNKVRDDFLKYYLIKKAIIFEKGIFDYTGTNVIVCFFEKKKYPKNEPINFEGIKINKEIKKERFYLSPENHYRSGNEFDMFVNNHYASNRLKIKFYLTIEEINKNTGDNKIEVIDVNDFDGKKYEKKEFYVNINLYEKIKSNILFVRTLDTGNANGRAGLYKIKDVFNVDGILVTKARYRTHPIQLFTEPILSYEEQILLMNYFNIVLEYFRKITDSEFMTTYKYSDSEYTRKYLGLSQVKKLIDTFPWSDLTDKEKSLFKNFIDNKDIDNILSLIKNKNKRSVLDIWF